MFLSHVEVFFMMDVWKFLVFGNLPEKLSILSFI